MKIFRISVETWLKLLENRVLGTTEEIKKD